MGRLDECGSRGECVGLFPVLQEVAYSIYDLWGNVLRLNEGIFELDKSSSSTNGRDDDGMDWERPIDLITSCWTPIATNFMTDPAIKMALFSPGIGSILQVGLMNRFFILFFFMNGHFIIFILDSSLSSFIIHYLYKTNN